MGERVSIFSISARRAAGREPIGQFLSTNLYLHDLNEGHDAHNRRLHLRVDEEPCTFVADDTCERGLFTIHQLFVHASTAAVQDVASAS
jgi:hypothetical protein